MTIINTGRTVVSKYIRKQCPNDCRCTRCQREQSANPVLVYVSTLIEHIPDPEDIATEQYVNDAVSGIVIDISNKADKVDGAVENNFSSLDSEGNLLDSGYAASDFVDSQDLQDHIDDTNNPHQVTAGQVGADVVGSAATVQGNLDTHTGDATIHFTQAQISISPSQAGFDAGDTAWISGARATVADGADVAEQDDIAITPTLDTGGNMTAARNRLATGTAPNRLGVGAVDLQSARSGPTRVASGNYATTGGGYDNTTSGNYATTPGGAGNVTAGAYSITGGRRAKNTNSAHSGVLILSDGNNEDATSTAANQATLQYRGGIRLITATDGSGTPTKYANIDTSGVIRLADDTARAAQRTELGLGSAATADADDFDAVGSAAAVASDLSDHEDATGAGVHGAGATGAAVLAAATEASARAAILASPLRPAQTDIAGTTHTFTTANEGQIVASQSGSATEFSIPLNSAQAFPVGAIVGVEQHGAGMLTIKAVAGVTLNGVDGASKSIVAQWGAAAIRKISTDGWAIIGAIS